MKSRTTKMNAKNKRQCQHMCQRQYIRQRSSNDVTHINTPKPQTTLTLNEIINFVIRDIIHAS